jgi:hypothetical protein
MDDCPNLTEIVESASRETGTAAFKFEPFVMLAHEAVVEMLVEMRRPSVLLDRIEKIRQRMILETDLSADEIEQRLTSIPLLDPWEAVQKIWETMFMIDLEPRNKERFGVDWKTIADKIGNYPVD